jgi:hypothetical protein
MFLFKLEIWYLNSEGLNLTFKKLCDLKLKFEFQIIILDSRN